MKKVLAIVLSALMLMSIMPVAFATEDECKHTFDNVLGERPNISVDGYCYCSKCGVRSANYSGIIEVWTEAFGIYYSAYEVEGAYSPSELNAYGASDLVFYLIDGYIRGGGHKNEYDITKLTEKDQATADEITEKSRVIIDAFKEKNYTVIYDGTRFAYYYVQTVMATRAHDIRIEYSDEFENNFEEDEDLFIYTDMIYDIINAAKNGEEIKIDTEELIRKGERLTFFMENTMACVYGNHRWSEYTENADGSKTAHCSCCTATDTIKAEKKDILDIVSTDLVELVKIFLSLIKSFIEAVIIK